ncbi:MAG: hypothetical protein ACK4TL_10970 [Hyphomicrobiaceae bacterium]
MRHDDARDACGGQREAVCRDGQGSIASAGEAYDGGRILLPGSLAKGFGRGDAEPDHAPKSTR